MAAEALPGIYLLTEGVWEHFRIQEAEISQCLRTCQAVSDSQTVLRAVDRLANGLWSGRCTECEELCCPQVKHRENPRVRMQMCP